MNRATYQMLILSMAMAPAVAFAQTTHNVELIGLEFVPKDITVRVGDTVHWVWVSGVHNVESGIIVDGVGMPDEFFRSGDPTGVTDTTWDLTIDQDFVDATDVPNNRYDYYCVVHTFFDMAGSVTVVVGGCTSDKDCDDGDACNGAETCVANACIDGTPIDCNDGNVCTDDTCDVLLGCQNTDNSRPCDDGDACTSGDSCSAGVCVGGAPPNCDDGNGCTDDTCDVALGCQNINNTAPCDDANICTSADTCSNGVCVGQTIATCCLSDGACDDSNACTIDTCNTNTNTCVNTPTEPCCDGDAECDDGNVCTDDTCGGGTCSNVANTADCDDGDACTKNDVCSQGACAGVTIDGCDTCDIDSECDDNEECTTDSCVDGACRFSAIVGCPSSGAPLPVDSDTDGVEDEDDLCDETVAGATVDSDGCSCDQLDDDGDGTDNCSDRCPDTPDSQAADDDGCSASQLDSDADGVSDALDDCPDTEQGQIVGDDGCASDSADDAATAPTPDDEDGAGQSVDLGSDDAGPSVRLCGLFGMIPWLLTLTGLHWLRHRCALGNSTTRGRSAARGNSCKKRP